MLDGVFRSLYYKGLRWFIWVVYSNKIYLCQYNDMLFIFLWIDLTGYLKSIRYLSEMDTSMKFYPTVFMGMGKTWTRTTPARYSAAHLEIERSSLVELRPLHFR